MARTSAQSTEAELLARGTVTLPKALRDAHGLTAGMRFTVIDMGDGALMLVPRRLTVDAIAQPLRDALAAKNQTLAQMLASLDQQRGRASTYADDIA